MKMKTVVISKSFTTHKRGESEEDIQDSVNIDKLKGRYALSDGLSKSFLPRLLADTLTEIFIANGDFSSDTISQMFNIKKEEYLSSLDEESAALQELAEETLKNASSTFVGLEISKQRAIWKVLGDSCLFIIPEEGVTQCVCSNKVKINDDGTLNVVFGNNTAHIRSDGKIYGNFITGDADIITSGWYILMSDTISEWFINRLNEGCNMAPVLFQLEGNDEFERFIEIEYQSGRMRSDDCTVVLIRIDENISKDNSQDDKPSDDYFFSKTNYNNEHKAKELDNSLNSTDPYESERQPVTLNHVHKRKCLSKLYHRIIAFLGDLGRLFCKKNKLKENKSNDDKLS